jgi:hypothetical protein
MDLDVLQRIGGWKTASTFKSLDGQDLADAGGRISAVLAEAVTARRTIVPLEASHRSRCARRRKEDGHSIGRELEVHTTASVEKGADRREANWQR